MSTSDDGDRLVCQIEELSGQRVADCYQCGCCTAGCPLGDLMEPGPARAIRLLQLGHARELLDSDGIWLCASCMVCGSRCPRGVDYAHIAEACRQIRIRQRFSHAGPETVTAAACEEIPQQAFMAAFRKYSG
ncbi:4Fe-4S dicluster domain-containing protein [candidate division WOR-3 bacterium]|nr:4Fe-4S dicluster domain-containing protein [candidate division WOR-3 bacterium]